MSTHNNAVPAAEGDEPAYLAQADMKSAAYPAGLVRSWTEHNRERYTVKLYTRSADPQPKGMPQAIQATIGKLLAEAMNAAASNGANSVSMPDEYVQLAVWLASANGQCCERAAGPGQVCDECASVNAAYSADMAPVREAQAPAPVDGQVITERGRHHVAGLRSIREHHELSGDELTALTVAIAVMGNPPAMPCNEELERVAKGHQGHPADFAADALQRWGGWQPGLLGYGGKLNAKQAPAVGAEPERDRLRAAQTAAVMPLIGPLLDAWDGMCNDFKTEVLDEAPDLAKYLSRIGRAMDGEEVPAAHQVSHVPVQGNGHG